MGCVQESLEQAASLEDGMGYMEPPRLWQPARHCLGFVYLRMQRPLDALKVPVTSR